MIRVDKRIWVGGLLSAALVGCIENPPKSLPPPSYEQLIAQADARRDASDFDGAKTIYVRAAEANPTHKEPWFSLARIDFDQQSYGKAIVNAQEVLQRDPSDVDAENILTVAGLRVAIDALGRLRGEVDQQGPAHAEAVKLAAKMRETLGQDVLVPPAAPQAPKVKRAQGIKAKPGPSRDAPTKAPSAAGVGDPFSALPGGSR